MNPLRYRNLVFSLAFFMVGAPPANAASFNFSGNFIQDDNVRLFNFSIASATTVTLNTTSFAAGGFTPHLSLFDGAGNFLTRSDNPTGCGGANPASPDPATGACWDAYLSIPALAAGAYTLALTEWDNLANQPTLADGFFYDGMGNFTSPGGFFEINLGGTGVQRGSNWAVTISAVDSASTVDLPEPDTLPLALAGLAGLAPFARRRAACQG